MQWIFRISGPVLALSLCLPTAAAESYLLRADGTGDFATIVEAVEAASAGDIIELADGTYRGPGNRDVSFGGKEVTVRSQSGDPFSCVIDCEGSGLEPHQAFDFFGVGPDGAIIELYITGGYADMGGAIKIVDSAPTIEGCVFFGNRASDGGGGIDCNWGAEPLIERCTFWANEAEYGGAVCI